MIKSISEIYPCLQGEGSLVGTPSILIRTTGCNLRCRWCDTPYTSLRPEKGNFSVSDIQTFIDNNPQIHDIIITGGEPCISPDIENIIRISKNNKKRVTLETNGTRVLQHDLMEMIDLVSLSPKLSNSTPLHDNMAIKHDKERIHTPAIKEWIKSAYSYQLKFVIDQSQDMDEVAEILKAADADRNHVYLMPQGTTEIQLQQKRQWLADICIREGFHYCERLHIVIYGDKRGV